MKIYELFEVSNKPSKNDFRYSNNRIYNNSLYLEAECVIDCNPDIEEDITDEELNILVERELENILKILKEHGRYPVKGIPKYVAY